jgi:cell division protease FtsH
MVTKWGLSQKLGPLTFGDDEGEVFLGHSVTRHKEISENTSGLIDAEIYSVIDRNYKRAEQILKENLEKLHTMAQILVKFETIDVGQISDVMANRTVREPADWTDIKPKDKDVINNIPKPDENQGLNSAHDQSTS